MLRRDKKVDWDRVEAEVKKEEKTEKPEGEQALQKLFRDIYSGSDEDTRRAMNKSFQVGPSNHPRVPAQTASLHARPLALLAQILPHPFTPGAT